MDPRRHRQFWMGVHRYSGLALLVFLGVAALTGCLLCFERPLDRAMNPDLFRPRAAGVAGPIAAVQALEHQRPELKATAIPLNTPPGRNLLVPVEARPGGPPLGYDQVFLDRGDGRIVGTRHTGPGWDRPHLMRGVYLAHYTLLAGNPGRWLMGVAAVAWLVSNLVGIYLIWPQRPPLWRGFLKGFAVAWAAPPARLLLDLHRAAGLWLIAPLTVLAFTSGAMNFFGEALIPAVNALSRPHASPFDSPPPKQPASRSLDFDKALVLARQRAAIDRPGWRPAVVQYEPDRNLVGVRITRSGLETYRGLGPVTYWFDGADGRFVNADDPYRDSAGQKLVRALYPLHTGEMIGPAGVALDLLLGVVTFGLCVTGGYLWLKRRPGRVAIRRARRAL